jgi:hypothetical protein
LVQRKIGNVWLKHAIETEPVDGWWHIGITDLARQVGFDSQNFDYLRKAADALMNVRFDWDVLDRSEYRGKRYKVSVLFPEVDMATDSGIRFQISNQMRSLVLNPEVYALIDMNVARKFRRAASLAIWEHCVRFERIGHTTPTPWQSFRDMVLGEGADNSTLQAYKYFNSRVLKVCVAEINAESNHTITLVEQRKGKQVTDISFRVERKVVQQDSPEDDRVAPLLAELVKWEIPISEGKKLTKEYNFEEIRAAINFTKARVGDRKLTKIQNVGAYFRKALSSGYGAGDVIDVTDTKPRKPSVKPVTPVIDIRGAFSARQAQHAEEFFRELDLPDQQKYLDEYNEAQQNNLLKIKKKLSKTAQSAFFGWLAIRLWDEPTSEELLQFAAEQMALQALANIAP